MTTDERVTGFVVKSHGLKGELIVRVCTDEPEDRFSSGSSVFLRNKQGEKRVYVVKQHRWHGARLLVTLENVATREQAEELRGYYFYIHSSDVEELQDPDEFYDSQLEGLSVIDSQGSQVGRVKEILHLPGGDVVSITPEKLATTTDGVIKDLFIPFTKEFVPEVVLDKRHIVVNPPDGLWEAQSM